MDIRVLETTMSITRNGIYIKKPILKAIVSSLIINAGITMVNGSFGGSLIEQSQGTC